MRGTASALPVMSPGRVDSTYVGAAPGSPVFVFVRGWDEGVAKMVTNPRCARCQLTYCIANY